MCYQVCGTTHHLLCACSGWRQLDAGPGAPGSFHRKGFQAQPRLRDKRTSVHPLVPSPSFLKQHSFMRLSPTPPQPPPVIHCLLSDGLCAGLVCLCCSTQAFRCSALFSPHAPSEHTLSREDRAWGLGECWGQRQGPWPGVWRHPSEARPEQNLLGD